MYRRRGNWLIIAVSGTAMVMNAFTFLRSVSLIPVEPLLRIPLATFQLGCTFLMGWLVLRAWRRLRDFRRAIAMNVRIVRDGEEIPCHLYRVGERDGQDVWVVIDPPMEFGDELRVGTLFGNTTILGMNQ
jgi:hypothetical protein